jgi:hypothetical protein
MAQACNDKMGFVAEDLADSEKCVRIAATWWYAVSRNIAVQLVLRKFIRPSKAAAREPHSLVHASTLLCGELHLYVF